MKNLFIILFSVLFSSTFCQNWNLINKDYEYHYAVNGEYNTTIKVDSFEINSGDTTFFLNRIVTPCDSCIAEGSDEYLRYNQPTFLQRQVLRQGNDFSFNDTSSFIIKSDAQLFDTWIFDATNSISAEVISLSEELIFGVNDSVKTILLSTNDSIIIAESFGIIQFVDYELIGVQTGINFFGFKLPKFLDFYDFEVGDVFQYEDKITSWANDIEILNTYKYSIENKEIGLGYIKYTILKKNKEENLFYNSNPVYSEIIDTLLFLDESQNLANSFNNGLIKTSYQEQNYFSKAKFAYTMPAVKNKYFSGGFNEPLWTIFYTKVTNSSSLLIHSTLTADAYYKQITEGLGHTYTNFNHFEIWGHTELIGYIKDGVSEGTILGDGFYTSLKNLKSNIFSIYPNPTSDKVQFNLKENQKEIKLEISNTLGEALLSETFFNKNRIEIDLSNIPKGIYFLKIETEDSYAIQKIIKK